MGAALLAPSTLQSYAEFQAASDNTDALCSICKQPVFIRRTSALVAIHLNQPGPPWAPHPCLFGNRLRQVLDEFKNAPKPTGHVARLLSIPGWFPLWHPVISRLPQRGISLLQGQILGQHLRLHVRSVDLSPMAAFYVLSVGAKRYLSTLVEIQGKALPVSMPVYDSLASLRQARLSARAPKPKPPPKPKRDELSYWWNQAMRGRHNNS